jgi:hypothetical protein
MAMKDYNSINFKNSDIDKMSKRFGKNDEPDPQTNMKRSNRVLPKLMSAIGAGIGTAILASDKAVARRDERYKKRQEKKKEKTSNK